MDGSFTHTHTRAHTHTHTQTTHTYIQHILYAYIHACTVLWLRVDENIYVVYLHVLISKLQVKILVI